MVNTKAMSNRARVLVAVAAMSLLASACGSDETETVAPVTTDAPTTTDAPETTSAPTTSTTAAEQPAETEVVAEPEPVAETSTTTVAPEPEPELELVEAETPDTTLPPEEPAPVTEPEPELVVEEEPTVTSVAPEAEPEPTVTTVAPEQEPTVTTVAPDPEPEPVPEPEPEAPAPNPSLSVEPFTVPYFGGYDFVLTGAGFTPGITIFLVVCTIPGDPVTPDTPVARQEAAIAQVTRAHCDLGNAQPVTVDADGSFEAQARGNVRATNFLWVASTADETETAAVPVFAEKLEEEPVVLQPGVWVAPEAGMVPPVFPVCAEPPYEDDCLPPSEWQRGEVDPDSRPNELPRKTPEIARWANWCEGQILKASCQTLLTYMKRPLDYLGAAPTCVLNEYRDRVRALRDGSDPISLINRDGWHNCATVVDPQLSGAPAGRLNDIGYRLSDTGISLAERCRIVLPEDVELEDRRGNEFGNDCAAWAEYVQSRPQMQPQNWPDCHMSARLAEEWMEHHHGQPESYYPMVC